MKRDHASIEGDAEIDSDTKRLRHEEFEADADEEAAEKGGSDEEAAEKGGIDKEAAPAASDTSSSDEEPSDTDSSEAASESSSSSESSSESEAEDELIGGEDDKEESSKQVKAKEREAAKRVRHLSLVRQSQLKRDELVTLLLDLPEEESERLVKGSIVRITVGGPQNLGSSQQPDASACLVAQLSAVEPSPAYSIVRQNGEQRVLKVQIRCKRGVSERLLKLSSISNQPITEAEFDQWHKLLTRTGSDPEVLIEGLADKASDLSGNRHVVYNEATVRNILANKPTIEFDAQKESRMRFLVQCALSQMDISSIRDSELDELDAKYKNAVFGLHEMEHRSIKRQEEWFEKRRNLYGLKEINRRNLGKQMRDDRHALMYTFELEAGTTGTLNPFQRRDCRPVSAWDTKLTPTEGVDFPKGTPAPEAAAPAAVTAAATTAATEAMPAAEQGTNVTTAPEGRVEAVLKAHRKANLLAQFGALMPAKAA